MHNQNKQTAEGLFTDMIGNILTGGMYTPMRWVWNLIARVNTMLLMVFLRKNMGRKIAGFGSWIYTSLWMMILFFASVLTAKTDPVTGVIVDDGYSAPIILIHAGLFLIFSFWRKIGAWFNLRQSGKASVITRMPVEIGDSVIYPLIRFVLKPLGLIDHEHNPKSWWRLTHDRWIEWVEPALLVGIGYLILQAGYGVYGKFFIFASICFWGATIRAFNNNAVIRAKKSEGQQIRKIAEARTPQHTEFDGHVIGQ